MRDIMDYTALLFDNHENAHDFSNIGIDSFLWEKDGYSRPESYASLFGIEGDGIHALLWSYEKDIRSECTERDDPVYTDSCLELFLMPVEGDSRYINIEVNPKGVFLSQIGTCREDRVFIKELTDLATEVCPMQIETEGEKAWGCEIVISEKLISALYQTDFHICEGEMKGNFYKCAELSPAPHFGAAFPVKTENPDFHRPEFFGKIIFRKA